MIDPRRLKVKISQIYVGHELQNFRPYSSFKSRILLATKHFVLDTFLVQILIFSIGLGKIYLSACFAIILYSAKIFKTQNKTKRIFYITIAVKLIKTYFFSLLISKINFSPL